MQKSRYSGTPPPRGQGVPTYQVLRPQRHGPLDLTILGDTILGVQTHWVTSDVSGTGGTVACYQWEPDGCYHHDEPLEWSGWLPVWDHRNAKPSVLRLAPREADVLLKTLGADLAWAGRRVTITPRNGGQGKLITVAIASEHAPAAKAPAHDVTRTICLVLGCPRIPRQAPPAAAAEGGES